MAYEIASRIISGRKVVAAAGTAEKLVATETQCFMVMLSADLGNKAPIVIGNSDVVAANGSMKGVVLTPGNPPAIFSVRDAASIYIDSQQDGDAVCFTYFATS